MGRCHGWRRLLIGKGIFNEHHMTSDIKPIGGRFKTTIRVMFRGITKKNTRFGARFKFVGVVWT